MKGYFISYCWHDKEIVRPLAEYLMKNGGSVWIDNREMGAGDSIPRQIRNALDACHTVLMMWSEKSRNARWSRDELSAAMSLGKRIIPCLLDDTPLPKKLRAVDILYLDLRDSEAGADKLLQVVQRPFKPKPASSARKGKLERIGNLPYPDNHKFTGRNEKLKELQASLRDGGSPAITAVAGLGGIGKTELAVHYACQHEKDYEFIWWLRSEGMVTLEIDFASMADELNLPQKDDPNQEVVIQAVRRWLEASDDWLLIFDNAKEPNTIRKYLPRKGTGHILITSRNTAWGGIASVVDLKEWTRAESIEFLIERTRQTDEADANSVAGALGDLPLAMEQAGAYIEATGTNLAEYQELFQEEHKAILARGEPSTEYTDTVATTWEMAFREIKSQSDTALAFLNLCAFFSPDAIPIDELREKAQNVPEGLAEVFASKVAFRDMLGLLLRYSLIRVETGLLTVHRLVQAVVRDHLSIDHQKTCAAVAIYILNDAFPRKTAEKESWPQCKALLPHGRASVEHAEELRVAPEETSSLLSRMAGYCHNRGEYPSAISLYRSRYKTLYNYHKLESREILEAKRHWAEALYYLNKAEALKLMQEVVDRCHEILGESDPTTKGSTKILAFHISEEGNPHQAEKMIRPVIQDELQLYGDDHEETLASMSILATSLQRQGVRYLRSLKGVFLQKGSELLLEARQVQTKVLEVRKKIRGVEHHETLEMMMNLSNTLAYLGNDEEALKLYQETLNISKRVLGQEHPFTIHVMTNMARSLAHSDADRTSKLLEAALEISRRLWGESASTTMRTVLELARFRWSEGHTEWVIDFLMQTLELRRRELGETHALTISLLTDLFEILEKVRDCATAEKHYLRILEILPEDTNTHYQYARFLTKQLKDHKSAERHFLKALEIDPDNSKAHTNLASILANHEREYVGAKKHYEIALEIEPSNLIAHNNLAILLSDTFHDYDGAKRHYLKSLKIDPGNPYIHLNFAKLLRHHFEKRELAREHYLKACELQPALQTKDDDALFGIIK